MLQLLVVFGCGFVLAVARLTHLGAIKGAIVVLTRGSDLPLLERAIRSADTAFNNRQHYPFVVFYGVSYNESRGSLPTVSALENLRDCSRNQIIFAEVNFSDYFITAPHAASSPERVEGFSRGYRDMCRFFGGLISDHEAMREFEYYIRIDSDSEFTREVRYDLLASMRHFGRVGACSCLGSHSFITARCTYQVGDTATP